MQRALYLRSVVKEKLSKELQRYFIAIIPPSPLYEEAALLKNYFKEKFNSKASLNSPPHITLHMPFLWKKEKEEKLFIALNEFFRDKYSLLMELNGFGCFAPRVIFLNIVADQLLNQFQTQLEKFCKQELNLFNAQYKSTPFHPHLTLAFRDLKKEMFHLAWREVEHRDFKTSFKADKIALLKHDGKQWQVVQEFVLKS